MGQLLIRWILTAFLLLAVSVLVPGFVVTGLGPALLAAILIGLVNATLGLFLKIVTFPLTILTFGVFLLVINALMLMFVSFLVPGFVVLGFGPAFLGALLLALLGMALRALRHGPV